MQRDKMGTLEMEAMINKFNLLTDKPVKYLKVQEEIKGDIKSLIKSLYDFTKSQENKESKKKSALGHLLIDDFDEEQIWQQVELQNSQRWDELVWEVANCMSEKNDLIFPITIPEEEDNESAEDEDNTNQSDGEIFDNDTAPSEDESTQKQREHTHDKKQNNSKKSNEKGSIVDDDFFKLKDMEKFLLKEEKNDGKKKADSDEESIDLFEDMDDEASDDEENEKEMMYSGFFNSDDGDERGEEEEEMDENNSDDVAIDKTTKSGKKVRFAEQDKGESDSDDDVSEKESKQLPRNMNSDEKKSEFEKRQERLNQQISKLEEKTLKEAPWQLKGEVDASTRPQNSLLQEVVDFDLTTRPPPIITEQTTYTLEDIIMRRVKDKAWDDVVKKEKPVDDQLAFRKPEVLDHSKSKLSLAQVYEAEYLKQKQGLSGDNDNEKEPEAHTEIRGALNQLFSKLDALSHYHYTPKAPQAEVKIISNTPAISMEEVAPVATSDAAMLAPEEVKKKRRGELLSKEERSQTDKKRERRKKKKLQRLKGKVTKVTEQRNTKKGTETTDKSLKTSKAFFQQLNDDSTSIIKLKRKNKGQ